MLDSYLYLKQQTITTTPQGGGEGRVWWDVVAEKGTSETTFWFGDTSAYAVSFYCYKGFPFSYLVSVTGVFGLYLEDEKVIKSTLPRDTFHSTVWLRLWPESSVHPYDAAIYKLGQGYNYYPDNEEAPQMGEKSKLGKTMAVNKSDIPFSFHAIVTPDVYGGYKGKVIMYLEASFVGAETSGGYWCTGYLSNVEMSVIRTRQSMIEPPMKG